MRNELKINNLYQPLGVTKARQKCRAFVLLWQLLIVGNIVLEKEQLEKARKYL